MAPTVAYLGGSLGHGPLWQDFFFATVKNRKTWFDPFVEAIVASKNLASFYEILHKLICQCSNILMDRQMPDGD